MVEERAEPVEEKTPVVRKPRKKPAAKPAAEAPAAPPKRRGLFARLRRWTLRLVLGVVGFFMLLILLFSFVPPPVNLYQLSESWRLGGIKREWVSWEEIAPVMGRSAVAAEDANFCNHWGFDMAAIREAIDEGGNRGASTISQQVVKNVFLWQGRSYVRKALEAVLTPVTYQVVNRMKAAEGLDVFDVETDFTPFKTKV